MKIAISGSSGFIGGNLKKRLLSQEHVVVPIQRDLFYKLYDLELFFTKFQPDYIIWCASYGNLSSHTNDYEVLFGNLVSLFNVLECSRNIPYKGFISFSSSSVSLSYETFYSATKAAGERIVKAFVNKYDKPVVSVRPYSVIGKGDNPGHLIPTIIQSIKEDVSFPFVGKPVHDYVGIEDFMDAIEIVMDNIEKLKGKEIEIGTGKKISNTKILRIVEKIMKKKAKTEKIKEMRKYDSNAWVCLSDEMKNLGWKPKQTVEQIIESYL